MGILLAHSREPIAEDAPDQLWIAVRKPCGEEWLGLGAHQSATEVEAMAGAAVLLESKRPKVSTTRLQLMAILTLENHGRRGVWNSRKPVGAEMKSMTEFETRVVAELLTRDRRNVSQDFSHGLPIPQQRQFLRAVDSEVGMIREGVDRFGKVTERAWRIPNGFGKCGMTPQTLLVTDRCQLVST